MRKPTNLLTPDYIRSLPGTRCQKVDSQRNDLAVVMPAMTWLMRVEGKWQKIPGPAHNARKYDRDAALRAIDRLTGQPEPEQVPLPDPDGPVTLGYALAAWKAWRFGKAKAGKLRDSSKDTYGHWIKHLTSWKIGQRLATTILLDKITDLDVEDLQEDLSDRPSTANKVVGMLLRTIYKFARRKKWTLHDPTLGIKTLPTDPFQPILSKAEFRSLYDAAWNLKEYDPAAWSLLLVCNTGARCTEAANIATGEISGNKWTIPASRAKAKRAHTFQLGKAQQVLIANSAAMWKTNIDKANAVRHLYQKLLKQLGIPKSGVHALRRHIASVIAEKHGIEVACAHLGHASIQQTKEYVKVWGEKRQEVVEELATMLFHAA